MESRFRNRNRPLMESESQHNLMLELELDSVSNYSQRNRNWNQMCQNCPISVLYIHVENCLSYLFVNSGFWYIVQLCIQGPYETLTYNTKTPMEYSVFKEIVLCNSSNICDSCISFIGSVCPWMDWNQTRQLYFTFSHHPFLSYFRPLSSFCMIFLQHHIHEAC